MRLTLNASETGHLVLATVHSSTCAEALQRVVSAFPAEIQSGVSAQLADCLLAVISQRLRFRPDLNLRVPECEILTATHAVKNFIRTREFFKIASALETGAEHGMWSVHRYQTWLDKRRNWHVPGQAPEPPDTDPGEIAAPAAGLPPPLARPERRTALPPDSDASVPGRIEIEPGESEFGKILKRPGEKH
jgi:twitching motility protein PilT